MDDITAVVPADAALLRECAEGFANGDYIAVRVGGKIALRLEALARVLEQQEKERAERTARCQWCSQPVKPVDISHMIDC